MCNDLANYDTGKASIGHGVAEGTMLMLLSLDGSFDVRDVFICPAGVKAYRKEIVFNLEELLIGVYASDTETSCVVELENVF